MATSDTRDEAYERVGGYLGDLIGFFTGGSIEGDAYAAMRTDLLRNPAYNGLAPKFLKRCRDTSALWSFAKSVDGSWEPRRSFLREQFEPLLDFLEGGAASDAQQRMPGPYDASAWTGVSEPVQRVRAVQSLVPVAQAAIETLISQLEAPGHNGGPPLDETEVALEHLRQLHAALGQLLIMADEGGAAGTLYRRYDGDAVISAEEHLAGWRFDGGGIKYFHPGSAIEKLVGKLDRMRAAAAAEEVERGCCMRCGQPATGEAAARLAAARGEKAGGNERGEDGAAND